MAASSPETEGDVDQGGRQGHRVSAEIEHEPTLAVGAFAPTVPLAGARCDAHSLVA